MLEIIAFYTIVGLLICVWIFIGIMLWGDDGDDE